MPAGTMVYGRKCRKRSRPAESWVETLGQEILFRQIFLR